MLNKHSRWLGVTLVWGLGLAVSSGASAERDYGMFIGAGAGMIQVGAEDVFQKNVSFRSAELVGGLYWRWVGVETRIGQGLHDETINIAQQGATPEPAKVSLQSYDSVYLRLQYDHPVAHVYALLGATTASTSTFIPSTEESSEVYASGNSWGAGAGIKISKKMHFNMEYKSLLSSDLDSFTLASFNLTYWL